MFNRILVCSDGSPCASHAAAVGASIARRFGSRVTLLDVFRMLFLDTASMGAWVPAIDGNLMQELAAEQHQTVGCHAKPIFDAAGVAYTAIQEVGYPISSILDAAGRERSNLIVMGGRGLGSVESHLLGSVSNAVLHRASTPVLIVHGPEIPVEAPAFTHILLASDGSANATRAAEYATALASCFAAKLTVVTVGDPDRNAQHRDEVRSAAVRSVAAAALSSDVEYDLRCELGHPVDKIVGTAQEISADLIVLGSRGMGGFQSMLLGSVSDRTAQHAKCPVMVIR